MTGRIFKGIILLVPMILLCALIGHFWESVLDNEDLTIVLSFLSGIPVGLVFSAIWVHWTHFMDW